jgi:hypothetical protein
MGAERVTIASVRTSAVLLNLMLKAPLTLALFPRGKKVSATG